MGITVDSENVYVCVCLGNQINIFEKNPVKNYPWKTSFGHIDFLNPLTIAVDDTSLYVTYFETNGIVVFSKTNGNEFQYHLDSKYIRQAEGIAVDEDTIYICNGRPHPVMENRMNNAVYLFDKQQSHQKKGCINWYNRLDVAQAYTICVNDSYLYVANECGIAIFAKSLLKNKKFIGKNYSINNTALIRPDSSTKIWCGNITGIAVNLQTLYLSSIEGVYALQAFRNDAERAKEEREKKRKNRIENQKHNKSNGLLYIKDAEEQEEEDEENEEDEEDEEKKLKRQKRSEVESKAKCGCCGKLIKKKKKN
jgi:hypothetical protein